MAFEQRDNSGALFKNSRKDREVHPDYTGSIMVDGREYWLSAWLKRSQGGAAFMSLAVKPKEDQPHREPSISARAQAKVHRPDPISTGKRSIIPDDDMGGDEVPF